ncbi:TPA: hypothetical protein ACNU88_003523 [Escherichia coli]
MRSAQAVQPADSGSAVQPCRLKLDTTLVLDMQSGADHPGSSTGPGGVQVPMFCQQLPMWCALASLAAAVSWLAAGGN